MKKNLFFVAAAALALTACTSDNEATQEVTQKAAPQAVAFDTYVPNTTRAGVDGVMNTTTLQSSGFGVFAQYSNGSSSTDGAYSNDPDGTNHSIPVANFMWNEYIHYSATAWTYAPLKYWPNETDKDSQSPTATSDHADKLSFFAYAPYVKELNGIYTGKLDIDNDGSTDEYDATPAISASGIKSGKAGGIEAVIANNAYGNDPWVRYSVATKPSKSVDLLWGVAPAGGLSYTDVTGGTTTVLQGKPLVDLIKPSKDQKIKFLFQHALARIGMTVVAAVDQISAGGNLNDQTKIAVKSVSVSEVTATPVLFTSGALNLKNDNAFEAKWSNTSGAFSGFSVSNADGGELNPDIAYKTNASTTWNQTGTWKGVTIEERQVIANSKYFMVIPTHQDADLQVTITYDVITKDAKVSGGYTEVENTIKKTVTIPTLTNNKAYNLKLVLGLTSVKLDAEVADWQVDGSTEVYLPQNKE